MRPGLSEEKAPEPGKAAEVSKRSEKVAVRPGVSEEKAPEPRKAVEISNASQKEAVRPDTMVPTTAVLSSAV